MINVGIILGRVGKKETKPLRNGGELTVLSIATTKNIKDISGKSTEVTTWHNVQCFSKLSEIATKYIRIGDLVYVQGEIQNKKIEEGFSAGQYSYSIHANEVRFIPTGNKEDKE